MARTRKAEDGAKSAAVDRTTYDLSVHNPNKKEEKPPTVAACEAELKAAFAEIGKLMKVFA